MSNEGMLTQVTQHSPEKSLECFFKNHSNSQEQFAKRISLEDLKGLKKEGITVERFLEYVSKSTGFLLHGSIHEIQDGAISARGGKVYGTNNPAIAILRSLYSNEDVNLQYPYYLDEENPLTVKIHTYSEGGYIQKERGFVYLINPEGFRNDPVGSWQFVKEGSKAGIEMIVETEKCDFQYPVEFVNDLG